MSLQLLRTNPRLRRNSSATLTQAEIPGALFAAMILTAMVFTIPKLRTEKDGVREVFAASLKEAMSDANALLQAILRRTHPSTHDVRQKRIERLFNTDPFAMAVRDHLEDILEAVTHPELDAEFIKGRLLRLPPGDRTALREMMDEVYSLAGVPE